MFHRIARSLANRYPTPWVCSRTMSSPASSKLIFAPGSNASTHQAKQFSKGALEEADLSASPFKQFHAWFKAAQDASIPQCEGCTLATAELPSGRVSARIVYLKELDSTGFVVYSNWDTSRKAADIRTNNRAALSFWWKELERQVRVEGTISRLSSEESQPYYDTRIRGSKIGAWASPQSAVLKDRSELEKRVEDVEKKFEGQESIPVPDFWGGARIVPETVEFWQGRPSRLHDRLRYVQDGDGWRVERLGP
jgi:pyridoxamine 5'-phosphate oxidase